MTISSLFDTPAYTMSLLGPRPIVARVVELNEHVVFWNGIILPYASALYLAVRPGNVYPTPNVKKHLDNSFRRFRNTNAIRKGAPDPQSIGKPKGISVPDTLSGYERILRGHLAKMRETFTTAQLFAMLDLDKAHEISVGSEC